MGTTWSVVLYGNDEQGMEAALAEAFAELHRIESRLSIYDPSSEWSRLNREADESPVAVSRETYGLLECCLKYSRLSDGAFDVSAGPLVEAWGFSRGMGREPSESEITLAVTRVGWSGIILDPAACTVGFRTPGMRIDPGGIGKGYAVEQLAAGFRRRDFDTGLVAASGSTIYGMGAPPGSSAGWPVQIRHPAGRSSAPIEIFIRDEAVSTSGCADRVFWDGRRVQGHLIDPRTGRPARGMLQVSVIAPGAMDAEAWTKPCFILGRTWAQGHLPEPLRVLFFGDEPGATACWFPGPPPQPPLLTGRGVFPNIAP